MTPGKIARVIQRLEKVQELERTFANDSVREELQRIARDVEAIERDLEAQERKLLENWFESKGLPLENLPKPHPDHEESAVLRKRKSEEIKPSWVLRSRANKERLHYHNHFVAGRP